MKKILMLFAAIIALAAVTACKSGTTATDTIATDTTPECTSLFDGLQYDDEGIAFIKDLPIVVDGGGRYDFEDDAPVYAGKWGRTAVDFEYCGKEYYIPVDENVEMFFPADGLPFPATVTIKVWRDYEEYRWMEDYEDSCHKEGKVSIGPFALITELSM